MPLQELMVFYTTLSKKVESLKEDLKYGDAYTRLIKKVKKLEKTVKTSQARRWAINVIQWRYKHDMEFDFDFDAAKEVSTVEKDVSIAEPVSTTSAAVTTASVDVSSPIRNTRVSTADDITMAETLVYIRKSAAKDKGE
ncbi:hypothetical protein Tco_0166043, partial [Tanacetum coccineum]